MSFQFFTSGQNGTIAAPGGGEERLKQRGEEKQTCLAVTVRSIEHAMQQEEPSFFGSQPELLILVASVESVTKQPSNLDLVVNDATGRIRVRQFLSGDTADAEHEGIEVGRYVHMFGQARSKPQPHFVAQGIRPVRSADEVSFHAIEAAHSALRLQRGPRAAAPAQTTPVKAQAPQGADLAAPALTPPKAPEPTATEAPAADLAARAVSHTSAPAPPAALSGAALREALAAFLVEEGEAKGEVGCSRGELLARFKAASEAEVNGLLSGLISDGEAITTIDDDHFQAV